MNKELPGALFLLGQDVKILHWSPSEEATGRDIDCAVSNGDPNWWLRLRDDWRLCQSLWHDVGSTYWVIDDGSRPVALDALEDPRGLGKDGFPTEMAFSAPGPWCPSPARAVYLTAKRLRKQQTASHQWDFITRLAREDEAAFLSRLRRVFSGSIADHLGAAILAGDVPSGKLRRQARLSHARRRFGRISTVTVTVPLSARRLLSRLLRPTGLIVLLVGPDGSGKSTLARILEEECNGLFRRQMPVHWRPGLLPRLGALAGRTQSDASSPHSQRPHGRLASQLVLAYYWLDFLAGGWLRMWPQKIRTGLVIWERGWWDMMVDPTRYRLSGASVLLRVLGRTLPRPDLTIVLEAPADVLLSRKLELSGGELSRQTEAWKQLSFPGEKRVLRLDASRDQSHVVHQARQATATLLEERTLSRLGTGWMSLSMGSAALMLPRGPRKAAFESLQVYQPMLPRASAAWHATRLAARLGFFRWVPRSALPGAHVRQLIAPHLPPGGTFALSRGNGSGRFSALLFDRQHNPYAWAKLRTGLDGADDLAVEASAIRRYGGELPPPLHAPEILEESKGILLLRFLPWHARRRPWRMDVDVATGLGEFFRRGVTQGSLGFAHGDCAPWNLLRTSAGWCLVDWETAADDAPPFFDLFHYLFRCHALLGNPCEEELVEGLDGRGWIGALVGAYAQGAGVGTHDAREHFCSYLRNASHDRSSNRSRRETGQQIIEASKRLTAVFSGSL